MARRKKTTTPPSESLEPLEAHLAGTLKPVRPPKEFVRGLRDRIRLPDARLVAERINWGSLVLAVGTVMSVAVLLLTLARALFHFFSRRGGGAAL
ncbi:MAG: hypothetical protein AB1564_06505 [Chloroflexota bacterium]